VPGKDSNQSRNDCVMRLVKVSPLAYPFPYPYTNQAKHGRVGIVLHVARQSSDTACSAIPTHCISAGPSGTPWMVGYRCKSRRVISFRGTSMLTIQPDALSVAPLSAVQPGELVAVSGGTGDFVAVVVDRHEHHFMSWLQLTGANRFKAIAFEGVGVVHAPKVLRLGLNWNDLQFRVDETRIKRTGVPPGLGCLLVAEPPCIVTKWGLGEHGGGDAFGISLRNLSREHTVHGGFYCDKWQLIHVPNGLPPETITEFDSEGDQGR